MKYKVTLNGKTYEVEVENGSAVLTAEYAAGAAPAAPVPAAAPAAPAAPAPAPAPAPAAAPIPAASGEPVTAPMPGTIIDIRVAQGESVRRGQVLVILEAMKMENEIVAPRDGVVNQILTSKGSLVDSGASLIILG